MVSRNADHCRRIASALTRSTFLRPVRHGTGRRTADLQRRLLAEDDMGERDDGALLARSVKVVDEGQMLGEQGAVYGARVDWVTASESVERRDKIVGWAIVAACIFASTACVANLPAWPRSRGVACRASAGVPAGSLSTGSTSTRGTPAPLPSRRARLSKPRAHPLEADPPIRVRHGAAQPDRQFPRRKMGPPGARDLHKWSAWHVTPHSRAASSA